MAVDFYGFVGARSTYGVLEVGKTCIEGIS